MNFSTATLINEHVFAFAPVCWNLTLILRSACNLGTVQRISINWIPLVCNLYSDHKTTRLDPRNWPSAPFKSAPTPHVTIILTSNRLRWFCLSLYLYKWSHKLCALLLQLLSLNFMFVKCLYHSYCCGSLQLVSCRCCIPVHARIYHNIIHSPVDRHSIVSSFCLLPKYASVKTLIYVFSFSYLYVAVLNKHGTGTATAENIGAFQKIFPTWKSSSVNNIMC